LILSKSFFEMIETPAKAGVFFVPPRRKAASRRRHVAHAPRGHAFCNALEARGVENIAPERERRGSDSRDFVRFPGVFDWFSSVSKSA
jgi:hypothetical protein